MAAPSTADTRGVPSRRAALWLLEQVLSQGKLIAELQSEARLAALDAPDRARAQRLALDVLANLDRLDPLIKSHAAKRPPLPVQNALRLGALELAQGAAAYGVVNDLVQIISKHRRHNRLKGLVNAVLRKLSAHAANDWPDLPVPCLPNWLRAPLMEAWGRAAVEGMERAHHTGAPLDLTLRTPETDVEALGGTWLPTGSLRLPEKGQVSALPGYASGDWWVQDAAAALPARLVSGTGLRVLDLCAAPGGKTMQFAAAGHAVTAVDVSETRMNVLRANLTRTGLEAELRVADAFALSGTWDAVLLDAPCSATGTIRRHPDLPHAKDGAEFAALIAQQSAMIDHAVTLLRPGGQLVFCTCSLLPDEGEVQIEGALARHGAEALRIDTEAMQADWIDPAWRSGEGGLRLRPDFWPEIGGMDGFYIAALRKAG